MSCDISMSVSSLMPPAFPAGILGYLLGENQKGFKMADLSSDAKGQLWYFSLSLCSEGCCATSTNQMESATQVNHDLTISLFSKRSARPLNREPSFSLMLLRQENTHGVHWEQSLSIFISLFISDKLVRQPLH